MLLVLGSIASALATGCITYDAANVVAEERVYQGRAMMTYSYRFGAHLIWGATARILHQFLELIAQ